MKTGIAQLTVGFLVVFVGTLALGLRARDTDRTNPSEAESGAAQSVGEGSRGSRSSQDEEFKSGSIVRIADRNGPALGVAGSDSDRTDGEGDTSITAENAAPAGEDSSQVDDGAGDTVTHDVTQDGSAGQDDDGKQSDVAAKDDDSQPPSDVHDEAPSKDTGTDSNSSDVGDGRDGGDDSTGGSGSDQSSGTDAPEKD